MIYIARHGITESNKKRTYMGRSIESLAPEGVIRFGVTHVLLIPEKFDIAELEIKVRKIIK